MGSSWWLMKKTTGIPSIVPNMLNLGFCWSPVTARALALVISVRLTVHWCTDQNGSWILELSCILIGRMLWSKSSVVFIPDLVMNDDSICYI